MLKIKKKIKGFLKKTKKNIVLWLNKMKMPAVKEIRTVPRYLFNDEWIPRNLDQLVNKQKLNL